LLQRFFGQSAGRLDHRAEIRLSSRLQKYADAGFSLLQGSLVVFGLIHEQAAVSAIVTLPKEQLLPVPEAEGTGFPGQG
jgi:hypothetical protein